MSGLIRHGVVLVSVDRNDAGPVYEGEIDGRKYRFWKHGGTLCWSCRRSDQHVLVTLAQGRSLGECVEYLLKELRCGVDK